MKSYFIGKLNFAQNTTVKISLQ